MKLPLIALAALPLAACAPQVTTVVSSVTPEQQQECASAAAAARGVPEALAQATVASATETGPIVTVMVGSEMATCKLNELGQVEDVTFGAMEP